MRPTVCLAEQVGRALGDRDDDLASLVVVSAFAERIAEAGLAPTRERVAGALAEYDRIAAPVNTEELKN